jgi:hypothetical protein
MGCASPCLGDFVSSTRSVRREIRRVEHARKVVQGALRPEFRKEFSDKVSTLANGLEKTVAKLNSGILNTYSLEDLSQLHRDLLSWDEMLGFILSEASDMGLFELPSIGPGLHSIQKSKEQLSEVSHEIALSLALAEGYTANADLHASIVNDLQALESDFA